MKCDICGSNSARLRHIPRSYGHGDSLLVIENVPVVSCPDCGESYMTAETARELDHLKRDRQHTAAKRPVPVATYA